MPTYPLLPILKPTPCWRPMLATFAFCVQALVIGSNSHQSFLMLPPVQPVPTYPLSPMLNATPCHRAPPPKSAFEIQALPVLLEVRLTFAWHTVAGPPSVMPAVGKGLTVITCVTLVRQFPSLPLTVYAADEAGVNPTPFTTPPCQVYVVAPPAIAVK